ncbi:glycosyl hydrolase family 18 protein [Streptomyces sp. NPDC020379]|uniref:glycosyl hydrolase family 18 protein n=1 Tax=Streptomyces sp. NPDC020379 TaxID=3365071 RepID=UPI0037B333A7
MSDASRFVQADEATQRTYQQTGFDPASSDTQLSYTSHRVAKPAYNTYEPGSYEVACYYSDFAQYDARLQDDYNPAHLGRGADLAQLHAHPTAYDTVIVHSAAITGDQGEKASFIAQSAQQLGRKRGEVTFLDSWGALQSFRNVGAKGFEDVQLPGDFQQDKVLGLLGGLRELAKRSVAAGRELKIALNVGGWTTSEPFHGLAKDPAQRQVFAASVVDLFGRFPMFTAVHLDWEYPGAPGNDTPYGPEDAANFALLVADVRRALNEAGREDTGIGIALSADVDILAKTGVAALVEAGADRLNLHATDFFGAPWAPALGHQGALHGDPDNPEAKSVDRTVTYLLGQGIEPRLIHVGYATSSHNARQATLTSASPLAGTYGRDARTPIVGSFESGVSEWPDLLANYLDLETGQGRNGFTLHTDSVADADFLYNDKTRVFISLDTPRTVRAKARYVAEHGLGGLFAWTGDTDNGLLLNAAREGLGQTPTQQTIDMNTLYTTGNDAL